MNEIFFRNSLGRLITSDFLKRIFWSAAGACALGGLYAWRIGEHWLRIEKRPMPLPNLGAELHNAKLAHISDLHCSPIVLERYLRQCVEIVNSLHPDYVAITGDLITGSRNYARMAARIIKELQPKFATVVCLGNHDYGVFHPQNKDGVSGLGDYLTDQLRQVGVYVLRNDAICLNAGNAQLQFVGVDDMWTDFYDPFLAIEKANPQIPTIALCHNPDAAWHLAYHGATWVLAGHTHGSGQSGSKFKNLILPSPNRLFYAGEYALGGGKYLYVNRGLSYAQRWNLNSRPEITLFTLCPENSPPDSRAIIE